MERVNLDPCASHRLQPSLAKQGRFQLWEGLTTVTTSSTLSIKCPHCRSAATTRTSREITPVYREVYFSCSNFECGHTYKAALSIVATISPSAMPDPRVVIPMAPQRPRPSAPAIIPANDDDRVAAKAANDDQPRAAPNGALPFHRKRPA